METHPQATDKLSQACITRRSQCSMVLLWAKGVICGTWSAMSADRH